MSFHRSADGPDPLRSERAVRQEERRSVRSSELGEGTLACPRCDAPVALPAGAASPAALLGCPYCLHAGPAREFLSLGAPSRPARVRVRVLHRLGRQGA